MTVLVNGERKIRPPINPSYLFQTTLLCRLVCTVLGRPCPAWEGLKGPFLTARMLAAVAWRRGIVISVEEILRFLRFMIYKNLIKKNDVKERVGVGVCPCVTGCAGGKCC